MVSAIDAEGTMVLVIHSNSYPRFGSGLIVGEFDLILANRAGRGFNADPAHPNFPAAGRRPATTLHAWGVAQGEGTRMLGATPGAPIRCRGMPRRWRAFMAGSVIRDA
jgi:gamma-glutamyltranspeptidase/glutathione hydrolase